MKRALIPHPDTASRSIERIEVEIERSMADTLWLRFHVDAPLDALVMPDPAAPSRMDNLWQTTCFEMFVRSPGFPGYLEFNFSPSSRWAAYRFDGYRSGSADIAMAIDPEIVLDASESHLALETTLCLSAPWNMLEAEIGLSAVIEETDGTKSYWALAHPPGAPDFHHPDCFALELAAPDAA